MAKHDVPDRRVPQETVTVPVIEETLAIGRREVEAGAVRVRKEVVETEVEIDEPLVHEVVDTERVPVNRVIDGPLAPRHEGDVLVVPIVEERLVVHRQLVLVEELRITRRRESRPAGHAPVRLRQERAVVERLDPATGKWMAEDAGTEPPSGPGPPD